MPSLKQILRSSLPVLLLGLPAPADPEHPIPVVPDRPGFSFCLGEYADELTALSASARRAEQQQDAYAFCVRTTATYECPSYGPDGQLRRKRRTATAHGTAFGLRHDDQGTLLVTNQHVAEWPAVTDEDHRVDGIPPGCKRIADALRIVDDESDKYSADDLPLSRVVSDPSMDIAILRSPRALPVLPWKIGHSGGLRVRNVVDVRGFPLGVFSATNVGKVVSEHDHDSFKDWNHDDFVIDALLSQGNSGSPVLAVSCSSGEFELVGVFHAGYTQGSALNVVVGIDQLKPLLTTLKRDAPRDDGQVGLDGVGRTQLLTAVRTTLDPYFPFGNLVAAVRGREDGVLLYELFSPEFPTRTNPVLVMEDLPSATPAGFGAMGRIWFGNRRGLKTYEDASLEPEVQALLPRIIDAFRKQSTTSFALRAHELAPVPTRAEFDVAARLQRELDQRASKVQDLAQTALEVAGRLGPSSADATVTLGDVLAPGPPRAVVGAPGPSAPSSAVGEPVTSRPARSN